MQDQYIPGVCNIGKSEIERRKQAGWIGLIATVSLYSLFVYLDVSRIWRLVIFIPAVMAAVGFLQARMHFCAYFGMRGVFNFEEIGKTDAVDQAEFRAKDRGKAWYIIIYSVIAGIIIAALAYFLPP
jgi:hypothetical protein